MRMVMKLTSDMPGHPPLWGANGSSQQDKE